MATKNIAMNESKNAAQQQVTDEIAGVNVGEMTLDAIRPAMVPIEGSEYQVKGDDGKDVTFESVAPNIGSEAAKPAKAVTLKRKVTLKTKTPETSNMEPETSLSAVTLVTYTTKRGETAPRIIGFSGEDDPRWKPIYDEKQALVAEYTKAKKKDPKAKMTSSPFGPAWLTDREGSGEKQYCMTFGVRYMDVARKLCEAYNTTDREAWKQAEQAVRQTKQGIVSDYQAEKAARRAERERLRVGDGTSGMAQKAAAAAQPEPAPAMSDDDRRMFDLFKRFMQNDPEVVAMVNERKAA